MLIAIYYIAVTYASNVSNFSCLIMLLALNVVWRGEGV